MATITSYKRYEMKEPSYYAPNSQLVGHAYELDVYKIHEDHSDVASGFVVCDPAVSASRTYNWSYFDIRKDGSVFGMDYDVPCTFAHHVEIANLFNEEKD